MAMTMVWPGTERTLEFEIVKTAEQHEITQWARELYSDLPQGACVCLDGKIVFLNTAGARLLAGGGDGTNSEIVGRTLSDFMILPDRRLSDADGDTREFRSEIPLTVTRADGSKANCMAAISHPSVLNETGTLVFLREAGANTSPVHDTPHESKLDGILDAVADGIVILGSDGRITEINSAIGKTFGYSLGDLVEKPLSFLVPTWDHEKHGERVLAGLFDESGMPKGHRFCELEGRRENGTRFPLEMMLSGLLRDQRPYVIGVIRDISTRRKIENELRMAASIIETSPEGILVTDADFRIVSVNPAYVEICGFEKNQVIGRRPGFINALESQGKADEFRQAVKHQGIWRGEIWSARRDGTKIAERISVTTIGDGNGDGTLNHAILISDITQRKQDEEKILYQAYYDQLTGLPNRTLFADRLEQSLAATGRRGKKVGLMFIDLDGFKLINDTLGHEMGDVLLKETAERLLKCVRRADTIARMGGDEFTAVLPDIKDEYDLTTIAKRILSSLVKPFDLEGQESYVSASIGIAVAPDDGADSATLIKSADTAMYRAKDAGKATFQYYIPELNEEVEAQAALKNGLSAALERREFHLLYMPKLDVVTGRITGVEALMRWESPTLGLVSPARFIPVLEEMRVVGEIGEWVLEEACWQWRNWQALGHDNLNLSINISARQLQIGGFENALRRVHRETGVPLERIELEINEKTLLSDRGNLVDSLRALREMEVSISMDDFGTGYAPLVYLKQLPIDRIKLDRSFIKDLTHDQGVAQLVKTIIAMAHALNRKVVAVGVETEEQMEILRKFRCNEVQGYYVSRPVPGDEILDALSGKT